MTLKLSYGEFSSYESSDRLPVYFIERERR